MEWYNVVMEYKSNHNVVYSCKYHVVWCPKYRRKRTLQLEKLLGENGIPLPEDEA